MVKGYSQDGKRKGRQEIMVTNKNKMLYVYESAITMSITLCIN